MLLGGLSGKESACQCKSCGFDPWVGKIPWRIMEVMESHSSVLAGRISWNRGAWRAAVHRVAKSWT